MPTRPQFPTTLHKQAAEEIVDFARTLAVHAVLLVNSCARGVATAQSDLDIALLIDPALSVSERQSLDRAWSERYRSAPIFRELEHLGRFSCVHLDFFDGQWTPEVWDDGGGPDAFEIEIGNRVAHSAPLWEGSKMFADLQRRWLPYYADELQNARLKMVIDACLLDFERIPFLVGRGLHFYAFDRLYHAFQEFLQALFIAHRTYPIAYNKWIREQVEDWLGVPALYSELPHALEIGRLQPDDLIEKAEYLRRLLEMWVVPKLGCSASRF
jgi:predicted nucleotidyltransferase